MKACLVLFSLGLLAPLSVAAGEVCWRNQPEAGYYMMTFTDANDPNPASMRVIPEPYVTDANQVNHWAVPASVEAEVSSGAVILHMHTVYVRSSMPVQGRPVAVTDFSCVAPITLPPPDVFGDVTCDGELSTSDALRLMKWAMRLESALDMCP